MSVGFEANAEPALLAAALQLGAAQVAGWSRAEAALCSAVPRLSGAVIAQLRERIVAGEDPLGQRLMALRSRAQRRDSGATYTPAFIVGAMLAWAQQQRAPERVVDPGAGSGRFLLRAAECFPRAQLLGVELDPVAAAIARANLAASGHARRARVLLQDYRAAALRSAQRTLFIGNPPYVRHHRIEPRWKRWLSARAAALGHPASQLAGLHAHFFLATALAAQRGDCGALITAAEWLDVNYGRLLRALFLGALGGCGIVLLEPTLAPFADAASTAAITLFRPGSRPRAVRLRRIAQLGELRDLPGGVLRARARLEHAQRWSGLARPVRGRAAGMIELGELCRVHRGQVTGANHIWIAGAHAAQLPAPVLYRSVTRARELYAAGAALTDAGALRSVVDLPEALDQFTASEKRAIEAFLRFARRQGAHAGYIARHRRPWWSVGLRAPAPILATYMARRPPAFTRNLVRARHLNIAHGLYPRQQLSEQQLGALVAHLAQHTDPGAGRTYAGGLTKFEPREMERLWVPLPSSEFDPAQGVASRGV